MFVGQYYDHPKLIEVIRLLIHSGVDINAQNNRQWDVLHIVCSHYQRENLIDIVRLLIQSGVNVQSKTNDNWNALLLVCNYPHRKGISQTNVQNNEALVLLG